MTPITESYRRIADRLRELLDYDPDTGIFVWKEWRGGTAKAGVRAGCDNGSRYWTISVDGCVYKAHQLAWLYVHGEWPSERIDHIDGDPSNNRIANLRLATHSQNIANSGPRRNNKSGFKGAHQLPSGRWSAQIRQLGRTYYLGSFDTPQEAASAYLGAARVLYGQFARGT